MSVEPLFKKRIHVSKWSSGDIFLLPLITDSFNYYGNNEWDNRWMDNEMKKYNDSCVDIFKQPF